MALSVVLGHFSRRSSPHPFDGLFSPSTRNLLSSPQKFLWQEQYFLVHAALRPVLKLGRPPARELVPLPPKLAVEPPSPPSLPLLLLLVLDLLPTSTRSPSVVLKLKREESSDHALHTSGGRVWRTEAGEHPDVGRHCARRPRPSPLLPFPPSVLPSQVPTDTTSLSRGSNLR